MKAANIMPIKNVETAEVKVISASQQKFNFPDLPNLRGKKVTAIETFKVANVSKAPSGAAVVNATAFAFGYLTIQEKGKEKVKELPLSSLVCADNDGVLKNFDNFDIDYQKSSVFFATTTGLVANEVVLFAFYYE